MKFVVAFLIVVVWPGATAWALSVTPPRGGDEGVDLAYDPHWRLPTPPAPTVGEKAARRVTATSTTTRVAPRRTVVPRPPVPRSRPNGDGCGGWRSLVDDYAWDVDRGCRILLCESGGDPTNYNGRSRGIPWSANRASGLWQHLPAPPKWQDPYVSTALAWSKYQSRGWSPWVCR